VFTGDGVPGIGEVKQDGTIFENDRVGSAAEEILQRSDERLRRHQNILPVLWRTVCDD
jgi:hypothetical protein